MNNTDKNVIININGTHGQSYVAQNKSKVTVINNLQVRSIKDASADLRSWYGFINKTQHIHRKETDQLLSWLKEENKEKPEERIHLLVGEAGSGKSVILRDVLLQLESQNIKVLGLKADQLFIKTDNLDTLLGLGKPIIQIIQEIANHEKFVLIIDQIDALSSALSSDRTSLHSINTLINEVCQINNVSVLVSCRPYDLNYDPKLEQYKNNNYTQVQGLSIKEVEEILKEAKISIDNGNEILLNFLTNPLNLFLFCRVNHGNTFKETYVNRTQLYEALWKELIIDCEVKSKAVTCDKLIRCLNDMTQQMYKEQRLSISEKRILSKYPHELKYLESNGFICSKQDESQIQFRHQSQYDYVYAKIYAQNDKNPDDILIGIHQGLFVRLRLKQILFYLRETDEEEYLKQLKQLLFDKEKNGKDKFRFHLKHLILSNLGYLNQLQTKEKHYISQKILSHPIYSQIFIESISTKAGLELFIQAIDNAGGIRHIDEYQQNLLISACRRVMYVDLEFVIDYILTIHLECLNESARKTLEIAINYAPLNPKCIDKICKLIDDWPFTNPGITFHTLLVNLIPFIPDYVGKKAQEIIETILDENEQEYKRHPLRIEMPDELSSLINGIKNQNENLAFYRILEILQTISRKTIFLHNNNLDIKSSSPFIAYNRNSEVKSFEHKLLTYLLDTAESKGKTPSAKFDALLMQLSQSSLATDVLIALCSYTENIENYKDKAFILTKRMLQSSYHSSILSYYSRLLFGKLFSILSTVQKDQLMQILENYIPTWEKDNFKDKGTNTPLTYIGFSKAHYYAVLPEEEIKAYPKAKREFKEMQRKFGKIENLIPYSSRWSTGWRPLKEAAYVEMSVPELVKTMLEIKEDNLNDWEQPTRTGHAMALRDNVHKRPDIYYEAYIKALDKDVNLTYPIYGIESFLSINYNIKSINVLTKKTITKLNTEVNQNDASDTICVCRLINHYVKANQDVPDCLFDFAYNVIMKWDDSEYKTEQGSKMNYQDGINQVRGAAAEVLLYCTSDYERIDKIFEAIEKVAEDGAVPTRDAALLQLAKLMNYDKERCKQLFLKITGDHATTLLNHPLHQLNVLLYLINYDFDSLIDYFEACQSNPDAHANTVPLLWSAWVQGKEQAQAMMYRMADATETSRNALIKTAIKHYSDERKDKTFPILFKYIDIDNAETGNSYNTIFYNLNKWNKKDQETFMDKYVESHACKYASYAFLEYIRKKASQSPEKSLYWIKNVYKRASVKENWPYFMSELTDALITAYNNIKTFSIEDQTLEEAMDLLDEWLHEKSNRQYLYNYFNQLEKE